MTTEKKCTYCKLCGDHKSPFVLNNKLVCLTCDELIFDIEIECEELATAEVIEAEDLPKAA